MVHKGLLSAILALLTSSNILAQTTSETSVKPMLKARKTFGAVNIGGKILVAGGHGGVAHSREVTDYLNSAELYDPNTNQWSAVANRIRPTYGFEMVAYDKKVYAFGGFGYQRHDNGDIDRGSSAIIEVYNTTKNQWSLLRNFVFDSPEDRPLDVTQSLRHPRSAHVVVAVGNLAYIIGGWTVPPNSRTGTYLADIEVFDMQEEKLLDRIYQLSEPLRRSFCADATDDGKIVLVAGMTGAGGTSTPSPTDAVTLFDPQATAGKGFTSLKPLPEPLFSPECVVLGRNLLVYGGAALEGEGEAAEMVYRSTIWWRDLNAGSLLDWQKIGDLAQAKGFMQTVEFNQLVYVLGGNIEDAASDYDGPTAQVELLQFVTGTNTK